MNIRKMLKRLGGGQIAAAFAFLLFTLPVFGSGTPDARETLRRAWAEYELMEIPRAMGLFREAEKLATEPDSRSQALIGQAFCLQFGPKGNVTEGDLLGATDLYRRALELVGDSHPNSAVYNSLMAECLYRLSDLRDRDPEMLARAETIFSRLETEAPDSLATQNLLLFRTLRNQTDFSTEESLESARKIEHYLGPVVAELDASTPLPDEQATLAPTMAAYLAGYHYWTGGYPESMKWLKIYDRLGPTSYSARANTLFRIARIAETKLGDPDTAAKYYRRFNREIRSDNRIFFAGERAELLESGTTESRKGSGHGK